MDNVICYIILCSDRRSFQKMIYGEPDKKVQIMGRIFVKVTWK